MCFFFVLLLGKSGDVSEATHGELIKWIYPDGLIPNATVRKGPTVETLFAMISLVKNQVNENFMPVTIRNQDNGSIWNQSIK